MTDEIIIPNAIYYGKENVKLDGVPAVRRRYNLNHKDVQVIQEVGNRNCSVFIEGRLSIMDATEVGEYVTELVNEA